MANRNMIKTSHKLMFATCFVLFDSLKKILLSHYKGKIKQVYLYFIYGVITFLCNYFPRMV